MAEADPDALAAAASLLLRHRLFPRAMAWNVQRQNESAPPSTEELLTAAAHVLEQQQTQHTPHTQHTQQLNAPRRADALDVARSFPLLQASRAAQDELQAFRHVQDRRPQPPTSLIDSNGGQRERLFRAMGKFLDTSESRTGPQELVQSPAYLQAPQAAARRQYSGMPSPERMTAEQQAAFQAMKISSYVEEEQKSWAPYGENQVSTPPAELARHQVRLRSPPKESGKKRTRGSTPVQAVEVAKDDEIAPSLARALLTGCGAKQCSYEGCKKIAVSKGLCRGHGGGRRCQHPGCTKCAQSRSPFCWAHGGGKRCEAPNCRRSRKTKRFCVDHVDMELTVPLNSADSDCTLKPGLIKASKSYVKPSTPCMNKASGSYTSADSDDSIGKQSTVSCDSSYSVVYNKENRRMPSTEYVTSEQTYAQYHQPAGEMSGIPPPSLQLPSLNEALLRTVPVQYSADARWVSRTASIPSPPAPLSSQYKSEYPSWPRNSD